MRVNAFDRAVAAERRRCDRMGLIFDQPSSHWDRGCYRPGELFEIGNRNGAMATYKVSPTGRVVRQNGGGIETERP